MLRCLKVQGDHDKNGGFPKLGGPFCGCPFHKDPSMLGPILGFPSLGELPKMMGIYNPIAIMLETSRAHTWVTSRTLTG